ncbi:MAG TPA: S9 family peptidase, partial [Halococcus sp.]|nr:S9 family peptidase [Halococcus sp.]
MTDRAFSVDDFYELTRLTELTVSPDGERVAFTIRETNLDDDSFHTSLFVVPADGSRSPHRLTRASEAGSPVWSPDGTRLGFLATREDLVFELDSVDDEDDEEESGTGLESPTQVWAFDLARGGDARQLTDFEEGVREFDWGPTGERIVVSARDPTDEERETLRKRREEKGPIEIERLQHKADGQGYLDSVTTYLFIVDVDSRETQRLDDAYGQGAAEPQSGLQPAWGPDIIAFRTYRGDDPETTYAQDAYTISPDGGDAERLTDGGLSVTGFRWSPDGTKLAFAGSDPENVYKPTETFVADRNGGYHSVSASLDRTLAWAGTPEWADGDTLVAPIGDEGLTRLVRLRADTDEPERIFDSQGRHRTVTSFDLAGGTVALGLSAPADGIDVYAAPVEALVTDDTDALTRLTALNDDLLSGVSLPTCERVQFTNEDGDEIEGLAYLPDDFNPTNPDSRPLIASIHGGPTAYDAPGFDFNY